MINKELIYITYQTFPAETANSLQTISNIKYLANNNVTVSLLFPLREKDSTDDIETLKKFYGFTEDFLIKGIPHRYPHGKIKIFPKFWFHVSHFLWARKAVKKNFNEVDRQSNMKFFTRSDWIAFFLARDGQDVTFECHQPSKLRTYVIRKIGNLDNVKVIFLNSLLKESYPKVKYSKILHNGVDQSIFEKTESIKDKYTIIFTGRLSRFKESRGIKEIISWFQDESLNKEFTLKIIGGSKAEVHDLNSLIKSLNLEKVVTVFSWMSRKEVVSMLNKSSIGLLINSSSNQHSLYFTSPLKYFEYLYAQLTVVAPDFPSHDALPFGDNINYFKENDKESFIKALKSASNQEPIAINNLDSITLSRRAREIIKFIY
jgi:glycosyltransferase involved in cell wall biosynthesis